MTYLFSFKYVTIIGWIYTIVVETSSIKHRESRRRLPYRLWYNVENLSKAFNPWFGSRWYSRMDSYFSDH